MNVPHLFIHSPVGGQFLATTNKAAMNIHVQTFEWCICVCVYTCVREVLINKHNEKRETLKMLGFKIKLIFTMG